MNNNHSKNRKYQK